MNPSGFKNLIKVASFVLSCSWIPLANAQVYNGCGILCGITAASHITGLAQSTSITGLIFQIINFILDIALLLAVLAIIIAGVYLITSNGDEGQKDKAKRIVFYAIIGILLILFSRAIVLVVNNIFF